MAHELPPLPYPYESLEPHIDTQTMQIHHGKHHQAYVTNLNTALDKHPELHDAEARAARRNAGRMPALPNLKLCRSAEESMAISLLRGGAIIIAGSGMCSGGRIVHHLKHNITQRECDVIFTGFQAVGTLGRAIVDGREHVRIHGERFKVNARIHTLGGFSAHGDQEDLLRWHAGVGGKPHTYLVHGEAAISGPMTRGLQVGVLLSALLPVISQL